VGVTPVGASDGAVPASLVLGLPPVPLESEPPVPVLGLPPLPMLPPLPDEPPVPGEPPVLTLPPEPPEPRADDGPEPPVLEVPESAGGWPQPSTHARQEERTIVVRLRMLGSGGPFAAAVGKRRLDLARASRQRRGRCIGTWRVFCWSCGLS
jgi:hypothetical protein